MQGWQFLRPRLPLPMSSLSSKLSDAIKDAMRAKNQEALSVLRSLKAAVMNAAIEKGGAGSELDDAEAIAVVRKQLKQREESARTFREGNREELAAKEDAEAALLAQFLPAPLDAATLAALIDTAIAETGATGKAGMGAVMKRVAAQAEGRVDGKTLSQAVAARLA